MSNYSISWSNKSNKDEVTTLDKNSSIVWSNEAPDYPYYDGNNIAPRCVIGLDRDGVINIDNGVYTSKVSDFKPISGSLEAVAKLRRAGHKIAIITNQGGIGKGLYTRQDVKKYMIICLIY